MQLCGGGCRLTVPNVMTFPSSCSVLMSMLKPDAPEPVRLTRPSSAAWAPDLHTNDTTERAEIISVERAPTTGAVSVAQSCIAHCREAPGHTIAPSRIFQAAGSAHQTREHHDTYRALLLTVLWADSDVERSGSTGVALARQ